MMPPAVPNNIEAILRRLILALFTFGLLGVATELIALGHYEDSWQFVPFVLIGLALIVAARLCFQFMSGSLFELEARERARLLCLSISLAARRLTCPAGCRMSKTVD